MKDPYLTLAKRLDALRVIPRLVLLVSYVSYIVLCIMIWDWFTLYNFAALTNPGIAASVIAFPTALLASLGGIIGAVTTRYFQKPDYTDQ